MTVCRRHMSVWRESRVKVTYRRYPVCLSASLDPGTWMRYTLNPMERRGEKRSSSRIPFPLPSPPLHILILNADWTVLSAALSRYSFLHLRKGKVKLSRVFTCFADPHIWYPYCSALYGTVLLVATQVTVSYPPSRRQQSSGRSRRTWRQLSEAFSNNLRADVHHTSALLHLTVSCHVLCN